MPECGQLIVGEFRGGERVPLLRTPRHGHTGPAPACHCKYVTLSHRFEGLCDRSARHAARVTANSSHSLPGSRVRATDLHDTPSVALTDSMHGPRCGAPRHGLTACPCESVTLAPRFEGLCDRSARHAECVAANSSHSLHRPAPSATDLHDTPSVALTGSMHGPRCGAPRHGLTACPCRSVTLAPRFEGLCDRSARHAARVTANPSHSLHRPAPSATDLHDTPSVAFTGSMHGPRCGAPRHGLTACPCEFVTLTPRFEGPCDRSA